MIPAQSIYPPTGPLYPVAQPQNTGSAGSAFAKGNTSYGSHSYNTGYDSISGVAQTQDYVKQTYPPSVQQHNKGIGGSNASDLTSTNSSIYGKTHSNMNKVLHLVIYRSLPDLNSFHYFRATTSRPFRQRPRLSIWRAPNQASDRPLMGGHMCYLSRNICHCTRFHRFRPMSLRRAVRESAVGLCRRATRVLPAAAVLTPNITGTEAKADQRFDRSFVSAFTVYYWLKVTLSFNQLVLNI